LKIQELPIHEKLKEFIIYRRRIKELYPPQEEAIKAGILDGKNILLSTTTATGKTFLSELAMVNTALTRRVKSVLIVPLRALAYEKFKDLRMYEELGIKVAVSTGEYDSQDEWLEHYDIIITTYEKFDSLLRHRPKWLEKVGILVIDEVHYINDSKRGPIIEAIISKLRCIKLNTQIIALSATIGNPEELAEWLNAKLVKSTWRPVELKEGVYYNGEIYFSDGTVRSVKRIDNPIVDLTLDSILDDGQVLIFTNSRSSTVRIARYLADFISKSSLNIIDPRETSKLANEVLDIGVSRSLSEELSKIVKFGIAFHHAGLDYETRTLIENSFRSRVIKVLVSTTTLAAGVNLPARRVIIHDYRRYESGVGMEEIPVMEYKQMAGRAGRPGLDPYGEAILIARTEDEINYLIENYIKTDPERITSKFFIEENLATQVLAAIASNYVNSENDILNYVTKSLAAYQDRIDRNIVMKTLLVSRVKNIIQLLEKNNFVKRTGSEVIPTKLGLVVNRTYLDPYTASKYIELLKGKVEYCDLGYLHIIMKSKEIPKLRLRRSEIDKYVELTVNYWSDLVINEVTFEDLIESNVSKEILDKILSEVKTVFMIFDWINEVDEDTLFRNYEIGPGDLRMYIDTLEWLIHAAQQLAKALNLKDHEYNFEILKWRVRYGVKPELLELVVNLEGVGRVRARALYNAGFRCIEELAQATVSQLSKIKGISEKLSEKIIKQAQDLISKRKFVKFNVKDKVRTNYRSHHKLSKTILDYFKN